MLINKEGIIMEGYISLLSVPAISAAVYWIVDIIKTAVKGNETFKKFIPLIAAGLGMVIGIIAFYAVPTVIHADNVLMAMMIGGASGLAATGTNQVIKQLGKKAEEDNSDNG